MKVNLKKIGALVAGATILASSAAFAGLMFGSTTLVDANGAPTAKVVIGSKSQPVDGVAAGLIAGAMAGATYKTETLTASVTGTADCTSDGGDNDSTSGTCAISNEKARLEITVPGTVAAGTWSGENLIGDWLNRELLDREDNIAGDSDSEYEMAGSDTSENANPFTDGGTGGNLGPTETFMYQIDGGAFSTFQDVSLLDADSGNTYVEMQSLWLVGDNHFDEDPDDVVGDLDFLAYTLKFDGPGGEELGIPVCTDSEDNDFTFCKTTDGDIDDATETHRLEVHFLGEKWIISEMEAPNNDPDPSFGGDPYPALTTENRLVNGGSIKLAKESVGGILNQGEFLQVDDLKFQLDDLEAHGDTTSAIISVLDANDNVLEKDKVDPGSTKEMVVNSKEYRFHVYKVAPGYTFGAKWADVAIFSHEIECEDGQELDSDENTNPNYECALGWKNLDAATGAEVDGNPEAADTLRTIIIYSDDIEDISSSGEEELEPGDYVTIVEDPSAWKLSYKGLDLTAEDRYKLEFELKTSDKEISESKGPLESGVQTPCTIWAPYIEVSSAKSGSTFEITRTDTAGGDLSDDEFLIAINTGVNTIGENEAATCDDDGPPRDGVDTGDDDLAAGTVFMRISSSSDDYGYAEYSGPGLVVGYDDIGDGDDEFAPPNGGAIVIQEVNHAVPGDDLIGDLMESDGANLGGGYDAASPEFLFGIAEKAGTGSSNEFVDYWIFAVQAGTTPSDWTFDFDATTNGNTYTVASDDEEVLYGHATPNVPDGGTDEFYAGGEVTGPVTSGTHMVEEGYISERGSVFELIDDNSVEFDMAHKLARAEWWLGPSETTAASASTTVVTLGEGEETTVGGVTVKVLEITEDVGACSANGGAVSCVADMSGVSAVIMPNNAPSVEVAMPYTGSYGNLVILDSDAVGVNTLVSVGGDKVNSVTDNLLEGSAVDWTVEKKVVREVVQGSKIVVAGAEGADTLAAAQDFVSQLQVV